ncbi:MAG: LLM class F420-dependent oxidoreductase, partial [Gammaproteobacteria bacterium]
MQVGLHVVNFSPAGGEVAIAPMLSEIAEAAEVVGVTHLSLMDHFFQLEFLGGAENDMLEGYTTLGYLAALTRSLQLGLLVTGVTYRHPGLLAKTLTTLDVLSGGRAWLGLGAAWYEREHRGLGVPFPSLGERFERLEETLQICLQMWGSDLGSFQGRHYRLEETRNQPPNLSRPHPRILIGGGGERRTLDLVARYADACNLFSSEGLDGLEHKLGVLRGHCERAGRDFSAIEKTVLYLEPIPAVGGQSDFYGLMQRYARLGVDRVML